MIEDGQPRIHEFKSGVSDCEFLILAAGFEDRAFEFLSKSKFSSSAYCIIADFQNDLQDNVEVYKKYRTKIEEQFKPGNILTVSIQQSNPQAFEKDLTALLTKLPADIGDAWIDISGMPTHIICTTLNVVRTAFSNRKQIVIYSAAKAYYPTFEEYNKLKSLGPGRVEFLPNAMAKEMSEVLMLETFSGHRSKEGISCLTVFAGYDAHRSAGVIESINPSMLLLLYGSPGNTELQWRLDLSKELHKKFESTRRTAVETVSTLDYTESIKILEEYYDFLFEDYDFTIAMVCSKMQVVAAFLFWERYREVQLVFPLPIGYSIKRKPQGVSQTFRAILQPRNSLYRSAS